MIKASGQIRPEGVKFFEDFSKRTLEERRQNIPELKLEKRTKGIFDHGQTGDSSRQQSERKYT